MSLVSHSKASRPTYDSNELRRCIALSFSPKDLRLLAEGLGASDIASWDRGIQEAARDVVRHFERLGTLDALVAKLAEARPLMEWPAPRASNPDAASAPPAETNLSPIPAPPAAAAPAVEPSPKRAAPVSAAPESVIRDPFAPAWPGTASASATNAKRIEGRTRILILAAAVAVVCVVGTAIFLVVRMGTSVEAVGAEAGGGRALRATGPARMAADAMKRSLESFARGCDLQLAPGADVGVWLFSAAYSQCGTRVGAVFPAPGSRVDKPRPTDAAAQPMDAVPDEPVPVVQSPRQTNPSRDAAPRSAPAPVKTAASDACVEKCAATKRQCNRGCGAEPTSSAQYDRWQGCQTQCLSAASKCQLACQ